VQLKSGQTIARYRLVEPIGEGGYVELVRRHCDR
jgi:hypothetical protein